MAKSYTSIKAIIISKLQELLGTDGTALFVGVFGSNVTNPDGYPICYVIEQTGEGQILDTHRNEREWQFSVVIHYEITQGETPESTYGLMLEAADSVIQMFDEDPMLLDSSGQEQCKWCKVVPVAFEYATQSTTVHRALLTIAVTDLVNRFK